MSITQTENTKNWIPIAVATRPFGIKGALKLRFFNENSDSLKEGVAVLIKTPRNREVETTVKSVVDGGRVYFDFIKDRTHAEEFIKSDVFIAAEDIPELEDDEVYLANLLGAECFDLSGKLFGTLEAFSENSPQLLAEVRLLDEKTLSVPFIKPILKEVSEDEKKITFDLPDGLLELSV